MKTYLFVAALLDEILPFYRWLKQEARSYNKSPLYAVPILKNNIQEPEEKTEVDQQDTSTARLQCFLYDAPDAGRLSIALLITGIGKVKAAATIAAFASQPELAIVKVGSVLAATQSLAFGDILRVTAFAQHDLQYGPIHRKKTISVKKKLQVVQDLDAIVEHKSLEKIARRAVERKENYYSAALCCSGDIFVKLQRKTNKRGTAGFELAVNVSSCLNQIQKEQGEALPVLVDMENAAVYYAAMLCKIPILVIAFVFDTVSDTGPLQYSTAMERLSDKIGNFCVSFVKSLAFNSDSF